jgi:hypothetical protein
MFHIYKFIHLSLYPVVIGGGNVGDASSTGVFQGAV